MKTYYVTTTHNDYVIEAAMDNYVDVVNTVEFDFVEDEEVLAITNDYNNVVVTYRNGGYTTVTA